jgi:hypothetical protein
MDMELMKFLFLLFSLLSFVANAQDDLCFNKEINPSTKKPYANVKVWQADLDAWNKSAPGNPYTSDLLKAYDIYKREYKKTLSFKKDKVQHCYMGCKIAQEVNLKTTTYVGWYKEQEDLTDCKLTTHFEQLDFTATVDGGLLGASSKTVNCEIECKRLWSRR